MKTNFALKMLGALPSDGNLFFSPVNIKMCLAMAAIGARGETRRQMEDVLGFGRMDGEEIVRWIKDTAMSFSLSRDIILATATRVYAEKDYQFLKSYLDLMSQMAGIELVDFRKAYEQVRQVINRWVETQTRERIKDLLSPDSLDRQTKMVLVTAIYFKGDWLSKFKIEATKPDVFHAPHGNVTTPLMYQAVKGKFGYVETSDYQAVVIPYVGGQLAMACLLPRLGLTLDNLRLENVNLRYIRDYYPEPGEEIRVWMPRFEANWGTTDLAPVLESLGMVDAFGSRADFSGISGDRGLYISGVYHKAWARVDEEGSEMAAATATVMRMKGISMPKPPIEVRLDRSYLYWVFDRDNGEILFMGRQTDPTKK